MLPLSFRIPLTIKGGESSSRPLVSSLHALSQAYYLLTTASCKKLYRVFSSVFVLNREGLWHLDFYSSIASTGSDATRMLRNEAASPVVLHQTTSIASQNDIAVAQSARRTARGSPH